MQDTHGGGECEPDIRSSDENLRNIYGKGNTDGYDDDEPSLMSPSDRREGHHEDAQAGSKQTVRVMEVCEAAAGGHQFAVESRPVRIRQSSALLRYVSAADYQCERSESNDDGKHRKLSSGLNAWADGGQAKDNQCRQQGE